MTELELDRGVFSIFSGEVCFDSKFANRNNSIQTTQPCRKIWEMKVHTYILRNKELLEFENRIANLDWVSKMGFLVLYLHGIFLKIPSDATDQSSCLSIEYLQVANKRMAPLPNLILLLHFS